MNRFKEFMKLWMRSGVSGTLFFILFLIGLAFSVVYYLSIKAFLIFVMSIIIGFLLIIVGAEAVDAWKNSKETK